MSDPLDELFSMPTSGRDFDLPAARLATALLQRDVRTLTSTIKELKEELERDYAPKTDVTALEEKVKLPIAMVYATAGLMLLTVIGALVALVVKGHGS